jgi:hypothetical protein
MRRGDARSGGREEEELRVYIRAGSWDEDAAAVLVLVLVPLQLHLEASAITDGRTEIGGRLVNPLRFWRGDGRADCALRWFWMMGIGGHSELSPAASTS